MSTGTRARNLPPPAEPHRRPHRRQAGRVRVGLLTTLLLLFAAIAGGGLMLLMVQSPAGGAGGPGASSASPAPQGTAASPNGAITANPTPTGNATSSPAPAAALEAAAELLFPPSGTACGDASGDYTSCPVSPRMEQRLTALQAVPGIPYRPMCRCSRDWESVAITAAATADTVDVTFKFSGGQVTMVVSMVPGVGSSGWVADDTTCNGGDLYSQTEPPPCWAPG